MSVIFYLLAAICWLFLAAGASLAPLFFPKRNLCGRDYDAYYMKQIVDSVPSNDLQNSRKKAHSVRGG